MANEAVQAPLFDISEEPTAPAPSFDVGPPQPEDIYKVPEVAQDRANKYAFGIGQDPAEIRKQLETVGDQYLRQSAASGEALKRREMRNTLLMQMAGKLNRPLTSDDLREFDTMANLDTNVDPATVLEEAYGKKFSEVTLQAAKDPAIHAAALDVTPDLALDTLDAVGASVAKNQIASNLLEELNQKWQSSADQLSFGSVAKGIGYGVLGMATGSQSAYQAAEEKIGLPLDYLQTLLPAYSTLKLGGWRWSTGESLKEQYQQFALLSPSEFKKQFTETVNKLAEDNLVLAQQFANGYVHYSNSDEALDNAFGYADWIGSAASGITGIKALRSVAKAPSTSGTPKATVANQAATAARSSTPIAPNPVSSAVRVDPVTSEEQFQHIKDFRQAMRDTVKAASASTPEEAAATLGDLDAAAEIATHKRLTAEFDGKDIFADGIPLKNKTASIFYPKELGKDTGSLSHGAIARLTAYAHRSASAGLRMLTNNNAVVRMTPEQVDKSVEIGKALMLKEFDHVNDAVLDVDHGGPFRVWTPEEQLVNVHTLELRLGAVPGTKKPGAKTSTPAPARNQVREQIHRYFSDQGDATDLSPDAKAALGKLTAEEKQSLFSLYGRQAGLREAADNDILDDDIMAQLRKDAEPSASERATLKKLGDVTKAPVAQPQKVLKLTGDAFIDSINQRTAQKGKMLARDLYDEMKAAGEFQGDFGAFRKALGDARKAKKVDMSPHLEKLPEQSPDIKRNISATEPLEEGYWKSKHRRDIGHGNTTLRNRVIDSEFEIRPQSKYKSALHAHYVEPPKGFIPESKKPVRTGPGFQYTPAKIDNDEQLMGAITELLKMTAKTPNDALHSRLEKLLAKVERRNLNRDFQPGEDTRKFDTDLIGSPYSTKPFKSSDETVERRVGGKDASGKERPFTPVGRDESPLQLNTKSPDADFVGRDYSGTAQPKASQRKTNPIDRETFEKLESGVYSYLGAMQKNKKTTVVAKVGTPKATLFTSRERAAFWGTNVYGLSAKRFRIMQQGNGFYISIPKMVDETYDAARDLQIVTDNRSNDRWGNFVFGSFVTPDEFLSKLSVGNRKTATYGPQEMHRLVEQAADNLLDMPKKEREELRDILIANRDHKYVDEDEVVRRGRFSETFGSFERDFRQMYGKNPSERQTAAYFEYVQLYDLDLAMRDLALVRDVGRLGLEKTTLGFHVLGDEGAPIRKQSRAFSAREIDKLPIDDPEGENFGVWVYDTQAKKGQFFLKSELTEDIKRDIDTKVESHGYKILELGNPLEKPLKYAANTDEHVNFIVVKDFKKEKYDWSNIPRRPGGHVDYQDGYFVKQPTVRKSDQGGSKRSIYEGDEAILNVTTEAQATKLAKAIDDGRKLLKDGRMEELDRHLAKNTPFETEQFKAFFTGKTDAEGNVSKPRFSLDDEFTWTKDGKNTFDMSHYKANAAKYENFVDAIRSKYNLFANNVDKKYIGQRHPDVPSVFEYTNKDDQPEFTLQAPRLIDPYESINSSLANVARSKYFNDYKIQAAENFIEEFASVMKTPLAEMRRNPSFYLHNPVWDESTDNFARIAMGRHVRQAHLNLIGTESQLGKGLSWTYEKLLNSVYARAPQGQAMADKISDTLRNAKNPVDMARAAVFHLKLGLFNVIQLFKQGATMAHATAIGGPRAAATAFPRMVAARWLALTDDPDVIAGMAKHFESSMAKMGGFDAQRFTEAYNELRKTGLYNVGGEYASRDDAFDPKVFQSKVGAFLDKSTFFFKEGERAPRLMGWFMAYDEWKALNPKKVMSNSDRAWVLNRADIMTVNMSRASNANIQAGMFSVPTQFFSYSFRMAEQIFGTRLTRGERARIVLTQMGLFGIPMGGGATIISFYDDIRQAALENGVDLQDPAILALHEGIVASALYAITGEQYNVGKSYGPAGVQALKDVLSGESGMLEFLGGATGSVVGDMLKGTHHAYDFFMNLMDPTHEPPTNADLVDVTKNVSSVSNSIRAYYMLQTGQYITRNETRILKDQTATDAFMTGIFGLTQNKVGDSFLMIKSNKELKQAQDAMKREAQKYIVRALEAEKEGDQYLAAANRRKAKAALTHVPQDQWPSVIRSAGEANMPLFEKVLGDFVEKSPPDQKADRLENAQQQLAQ